MITKTWHNSPDLYFSFPLPLAPPPSVCEQRGLASASRDYSSAGMVHMVSINYKEPLVQNKKELHTNVHTVDPRISQLDGTEPSLDM